MALTAPSLAEVRGTAFLGLFVRMRSRVGAAALERAVAACDEETRATFATRIRKLGWYPYSAYVAFLHALGKNFGAGDDQFYVSLGASAGARDLNTVFSFFTRLYGPERLIGSCGRVWDQYYRNAGRMEAVSTDPSRTVLRISDFPAMDPAHCLLMEGWMRKAMAIVGARVIDGHEAMCTSRGDAHHEFVCRWESLGDAATRAVEPQ